MHLLALKKGGRGVCPELLEIRGDKTLIMEFSACIAYHLGNKQLTFQAKELCKAEGTSDCNLHKS